MEEGGGCTRQDLKGREVLKGKGEQDGDTVGELNGGGEGTVGERRRQDGIDVVPEGRPAHDAKKCVEDDDACDDSAEDCTHEGDKVKREANAKAMDKFWSALLRK